MYIYTKLIQVNFCIALISLLAACAAVKSAPQKASDCSVGQKCILEGTLNIYVSANGSVGVLTEDGKCISLALPQKTIQNRNVFNEKKVRVEGTIHSNESAFGVISYTLQDREVLTGMCGAEKIMYIENISKI